MPDAASSYPSRFNNRHPVYRLARAARSRDVCQGCGHSPAVDAHYWVLQSLPAQATMATDLIAFCADCCSTTATTGSTRTGLAAVRCKRALEALMTRREQSAYELLLKPECYRLGVLLYLEQRLPAGGLPSHRTEIAETIQKAGWPVDAHLLREAANRLVPRMIAEAMDPLLPEEPRHPNFDRGRFLEVLGSVTVDLVAAGVPPPGETF